MAPDPMEDEAVGQAARRLAAYLPARCRRRGGVVVEDIGIRVGHGTDHERTVRAFLHVLGERRQPRTAFDVQWGDDGRLARDEHEPGFLEDWSRREAAAETEEELLEVWEGPWGEHPAVTLDDWRRAVADDDTRQGYWEYVAFELEALRHERGW